MSALYVAEPSNVLAQVVKAPGPKRMEFTLSLEASSYGWGRCVRASSKTIPRQGWRACGLASLSSKTIESLGETRLGDRMQLDFMPGVGTQIR